MKLIWSIKKKRGNFRPVLSYIGQFEDWEKDLNVNEVIVRSPFPTLNAYAGGSTRQRIDTQPKTWRMKRDYFHKLSVHTKMLQTETIYLPWRPGATPSYPEVPILMKALQRKYEKALKEAYDSAPFEVGGTLEMSPECKRHVAPGVAAQKILKAVSK